MTSLNVQNLSGNEPVNKRLKINAKFRVRVTAGKIAVFPFKGVTICPKCSSLHSQLAGFCFWKSSNCLHKKTSYSQSLILKKEEENLSYIKIYMAQKSTAQLLTLNKSTYPSYLK